MTHKCVSIWSHHCLDPSHYLHYNDVIMTTMVSQITSLTVVYWKVYSDADQRKHQSSASLAFVWGIHRDRWIPGTKGQLRGKCFHLMTSSWTNRHQSRFRPSQWEISLPWLIPEPMLAYCKLYHYEETSVKFQSKYSNFHTRKSFEDVCKMADISSQPQSLLLNMTLVNLWAISYNFVVRISDI